MKEAEVNNVKEAESVSVKFFFFFLSQMDLTWQTSIGWRKTSVLCQA